MLDDRAKEPVGVVRLTAHLQENHNIRYRRVYRIMKENDLVIHSEAKSRRQK